MKFWLFSAAWSFKTELKFVIFTLGLIFLLPLFAVMLLTNAGIDIISNKLATSNPQTQSVQIHDPLDGSVIKDFSPQVEWPVHGVVTLEFGAVDLPYQPLHTGIDIASPTGQVGDPVTSFMDGTVPYAGEIFWGYGKHIIIDHGNNISSLYGHLDKIFVYPGEKVHLGQVIGNEGQTGWATGPHVHFEVRVFGIPVNPRTFLSGNP